jgi:ribosome-binding factor A
MNTSRINKIGRLLQKDLSDIFQREARTFFLGGMVTVTVVRVSPDLSIARVYVSIFPSEKKEEIFHLIEENAGRIKYQLGNRVKNQLRKVPELRYYIDDSLDYADRIDQLLGDE